jgi:NADH-quinone oxidoreductase subunit C
MPLTEAITNLEQLQEKPALAALMAWNYKAVAGAKFDRNELSIWVNRELLPDSCIALQKAGYNFLSDITCVDWYPSEPRFELSYHILSHKLKEYVRLHVKLAGNDAVVPSILPVWPSANFFEREIFDLFGVQFTGRGPVNRIMMPDEWQGHPLRKDYPVEGYR